MVIVLRRFPPPIPLSGSEAPKRAPDTILTLADARAVAPDTGWKAGAGEGGRAWAAGDPASAVNKIKGPLIMGMIGFSGDDG